MKFRIPLLVATVSGSALLAGCGSSAECVSIPYSVIATIESGLDDRDVSFGRYGAIQATPIGSPSDPSPIDALLVAIELEGWPDGRAGIWKVGSDGGSLGPIFAADSFADEVGVWPLIRNFDDDNSDAESCI